MRAILSSRRIESCIPLKRITAGRKTALSVPWCSLGISPPSAWLSECTQPSPFWKASAPMVLAAIMSSRASRSSGCVVARSIWRQPRRRPSSAMPSAGGLKAADMKVSMQCAIASMPVAAVSAAGSLRVSSGSQTAERGISVQLWKPSLRPSSTMMIAPRATSEPVPAVVGTAISGAACGPMLPAPPRMVAYAVSGPSWVAAIATPLARSMLEPPPIAISPSQPWAR